MAIKPIPDEYHSVTPYLVLQNASQAIDFYKKALGATELMRLESPDGQIGHAEIMIGDSPIMLADEFPDMGYLSPSSLGGSPVGLMVYVDDVDSSFKKAIEAGGIVNKPLQDQFYGDRTGTFEDPFGHLWTIGSRIEDLSVDEIRERFENMMSGHQATEQKG